MSQWIKFAQNKENVYYLLSSAYASGDYKRCLADPSKMLKWGYFPELKKYDDIDSLISSKAKNSILWCARFIDWKHPETAVRIARRLKDEGYDFRMNMIGTGKMLTGIKSMIETNGLSECVYTPGPMSPECVRQYMEQSEIFLFTSDRNEGWGAVLNESMNSACAVVASHAIGSVPFLLDNGNNGLIYVDGNEDELYSNVKKLLDDQNLRRRISHNAYLTVNGEWNAVKATGKFIEISGSLLNKKEWKFFDNGPCSKAHILEDS